jgi:hypothetical protein
MFFGALFSNLSEEQQRKKTRTASWKLNPLRGGSN